MASRFSTDRPIKADIGSVPPSPTVDPKKHFGVIVVSDSEGDDAPTVRKRKHPSTPSSNKHQPAKKTKVTTPVKAPALPPGQNRLSRLEQQVKDYEKQRVALKRQLELSKDKCTQAEKQANSYKNAFEDCEIDLESVRADRDRVRTSLSHDKTRIQEELDTAQSNLAENQLKLKELLLLKKQVAKKTSDLEKTRKVEVELESQLEVTRSDLAESQGKLKELFAVNAQITEKNRELEEGLKEKAELEALLKTTRSDLAKMKEELDKLSSDNTASQWKSLREKTELKDKLEENSKDLETVARAKNKACHELAATKKRLTDSDAQCKRADKKIGTLEESCETSKQKLENLQAETLIYQEKMATANREVDRLKGELETAKAELVAADNTAATKEKANTKTIDALRKEVADLREQNSALACDKTGLGSALANAAVTKQNLDKRVLELQQQLDIQKNGAVSLQLENKKLLEDIDGYTAKIDGLERCIEGLEESPGDPVRIEQLEEEVTSLKANVSKLKDVEIRLQEAGQTIQELKQHTDNCSLDPEEAEWMTRFKKRAGTISEPWDRRLEEFKKGVGQYGDQA
ncbi:hypothetical protein F5B20DRAFT_580341 [Whalleya microplaca]|nr:hypothetical protein F5B20DRAFT_580341 [Whalleya microplaca]